MVSSRIRHHETGPAGDGNSEKPSILVASSDRQTAELVAREAVRRFDLPAVLASTLDEADAVLEQCRTPIVLADAGLEDGEELLVRLGRSEAAVVVIAAGEPSLHTAMLALRIGAADVLARPITREGLKAAFDRLARRIEERAERVQLRSRLEQSGHQQEHLRRKIDILCKDLVGGYQKLLAQLVRRGPGTS